MQPARPSRKGARRGAGGPILRHPTPRYLNLTAFRVLRIVTKKRIETKVPYSAAQMFDLVADVDRYPEFLPWCAALRVAERNVDEDGRGVVLADMVVAYKMFRERFRSRVALDRPAGTIDVEYVSGPFRSLHNRWRFIDAPEGGSMIDFEIDFEFRNFLLQATAQAVFDKAFSRMSSAFVARADDIYGRRNMAAKT